MQGKEKERWSTSAQEKNAHWGKLSNICWARRRRRSVGRPSVGCGCAACYGGAQVQWRAAVRAHCGGEGAWRGRGGEERRHRRACTAARAHNDGGARRRMAAAREHGIGGGGHRGERDVRASEKERGRAHKTVKENILYHAMSCRTD